MRLPRSAARTSALGAILALLLGATPAVRALYVPGLPDGPLPVGAKPVDFSHLHNVVRISERIYSAGVPEGDEGFRAVQLLGVKTIVSVDGMRPDVERAKKFGLRYVHLPFGYDSCPVPTANAIAKATRDLPGPVLIHCHHGKNRSPAAAALAGIAVDGLTNQQGVQVLERAGTGKNYTGLYADVLNYRRPTKQELDRLKVEFREVAPTPPMVKSMVEMQHRFDRLLSLQKNGWKAQPGIDAAYEALQLQELYTELNRTEEVRKQAADYRRWMADGERDGKALEAALRAGRLNQASMFLGRVAAGCGSCHAKYRNVPQPK
jgi:predicted protein tyrosine phosphatase